MYIRRKFDNWPPVLVQYGHTPSATFIHLKFTVIHFNLRKYIHLEMDWLSMLFQHCTPNHRLNLIHFLCYYKFGQNHSTCSKVMTKVWNPRYPPEKILNLSITLPPKTNSNVLKYFYLSRHRHNYQDTASKAIFPR